MSKYTPLRDFLAARGEGEVPMTFAEIERVIGFPLPPSKQRAAWWSNNPSNNVMTRAWRAAGFRTARVDVASERLVFQRERAEGTPPAVAPRDPAWGPGTVGFCDRVRAALGGTVKIMPGVDITEPIDVEWDAMK